MRPKHVQRRLGVYVLGALAPSEAIAVEAHLAGCPSCAAEARDLHEVRDMLACLTEADVASVLRDAPAGAGTRRTPRAEPRPSMAGRSWVFGLRVRLVVAAVALALAAGTGVGVWLSAGPAEVRLAGTEHNPATGVSMSVTVVSTSTGARIEAVVSGLTVGAAYQLYAVGSRGEIEVAVTWTASGTTQGVAGEVAIRVQRLVSVTAATARSSTLVTVPVTRSA